MPAAATGTGRRSRPAIPTIESRQIKTTSPLDGDDRAERRAPLDCLGLFDELPRAAGKAATFGAAGELE